MFVGFVGGVHLLALRKPLLIRHIIQPKICLIESVFKFEGVTIELQQWLFKLLLYCALIRLLCSFVGAIDVVE